MAITKTTAIDASRIKTRWEEPYVSSAINKEMAAIPRGIYRGFEVTEQATPAAGVSIKVKTGEDSVLVHRGFTSGHSTLIRYDLDFDIDFTFDSSSSDVTLYVWCDVNYTIGATTAGSILVGASGDRSADSITIAKIFIPQSQTVIYDVDITQDWSDSDTMTNPDPTEADWGFINQAIYDRIPTSDEKDGLSNASPAATAANPYVTEDATVNKVFVKPTTTTKSGLAGTETKFQLTGDFYIGNGAQGTAHKWFGLHKIVGGDIEPDEYTGGSNNQVYITAIYKNDDSAEVTPSSDADANGFYTNPYIYISAAIGETSIAVRAGQEADYSSLPSTALVSEADGIRTGASNTVSYLADANAARRPVTYTVSASTSDNGDFNGASAIIDALDAIEAGSADAGSIYVKEGSYIWDGTGGGRTYTKPIKIIGEIVGWDTTGANCKFTLQHSTGYGITFEEAALIHNMYFVTSTSTQLIMFENLFDVRFSRFEDGTVYFMGRGTGTVPDGGIVESCWFDTSGVSSVVAAVTDNILRGATWTNCHFISDGEYGFYLDYRTHNFLCFSGCEFNGTTLAGTSDGPGLFIHGTAVVLNSRWEGCTFLCRGNNSAILITSGAKLLRARFENTRVYVYTGFSTPTVQGAIDYQIGTGGLDDQQNVVFDGVTIELASGFILNSPLINITGNASGGAYNVFITVRDVNILGSGNEIRGGGTGDDAGIIRLMSRHGGDRGVNLVLDGVMADDLCPSFSSSTSLGVFVMVMASSSFSSLIVNNVNTTRLSQTSHATYSYWASVKLRSCNGLASVTNCSFNLTLLDRTATNTVHRGIVADSTWNLNIASNHFTNIVTNDIFIAADDDSQININGNTFKTGVSGLGDNTPTTARIHSDCGHHTIVGNNFKEYVNSSIGYFVYIDSSFSEQAHSFVGNSVYLVNDATDYILYGSDTTKVISVMGNSGLGNISYKSGLGSTGDITMNSVTSVTAR